MSKYVDKPIKMGYTIPKIADRGQLGGCYTLNHIVKVGKYTLPENEKGKQKSDGDDNMNFRSNSSTTIC